MNLQHLKYAVEVERTGSISHAAANLFMNQPNLSKAIKELEASLAITIFRRSSKGVSPTPEGAEFLTYARGILSWVEEMEAYYAGKEAGRQTLRISIPRSSYLTRVFASLIDELEPGLELDAAISEVGTLEAVRNLQEEGYRLAIVRYESRHEPYFQHFFQDRGLECRELWELEGLLLMTEEHPLAEKKFLESADLAPYLEIVYSDRSIPYLPSRRPVSHRRIQVAERGSRLDLLSRIPNAYTWSSPMPQDILEWNRLIQRPCPDWGIHWKDVLISPKRHTLQGLEARFLQRLEENRDEITGQKASGTSRLR